MEVLIDQVLKKSICYGKAGGRGEEGHGKGAGGYMVYVGGLGRGGWSVRGGARA